MLIFQYLDYCHLSERCFCLDLRLLGCFTVNLNACWTYGKTHVIFRFETNRRVLGEFHEAWQFAHWKWFGRNLWNILKNNALSMYHKWNWDQKMKSYDYNPQNMWHWNCYKAVLVELSSHDFCMVLYDATVHIGWIYRILDRTSIEATEVIRTIVLTLNKPSENSYAIR